MNTPRIVLFTRRQILRMIGAGVALTGLAQFAGHAYAANPKIAAKPPAPPSAWDLPPLSYGYAALEPHIDTLTMQIHHAKHHQAYITNAKKLLEPHADWRNRSPDYLVKNIELVPEAMRSGLRNNVGGHVNHSFFWSILAPNAGGVPGNAVGEAITASFGSFDEFRKQFADAALKRFGSGWAWLVAKEGKLQIISTANQDSPLSTGATPLLALDVWEHAYYLHYQNRRADYIAAFWNVVNWPQVDAYYQATLTA
jgi:Fe-Mn family superoxide dismutase